MLFGRSSSVSYHLSAETHQERIMIASTELDEEVFRGREKIARKDVVDFMAWRRSPRT